MKLIESFKGQGLNEKLHWHSEPGKWKLQNNRLQITADHKTDFWQRTHYGFQADNGHFLYAEIKEDFVLESRMHCDFKNQYDQAGIMVRVSDQCWVKSSVENEIGEPNKLGAVVTNHGYSDWATQDVPDDFTSYSLRITRTGSDYKIEYYNDKNAGWSQMRLFHLFDDAVVQAGIYCCSPKVGGFSAFFEKLIID